MGLTLIEYINIMYYSSFCLSASDERKVALTERYFLVFFVKKYCCKGMFN